VTLWGTWCPPCRREVPHFKRMLEEHGDAGLAVVGINYERTASEKDATEKVRAFVKKEHIPYSCLIGDDATREAIPGFARYPTTLCLDAEGSVRVRVDGFLPLPNLEAIVELLLDEVTPQQ